MQFMGETAATMGASFCLEHFVPHIARLANDANFRVRKSAPFACAMVGGVIGPEAMVATLFPLFQELVIDEVWGVRKSCGEQIAVVAEVVTPDVRWGALTECYATLAEDKSRWVGEGGISFFSSQNGIFFPQMPNFFLTKQQQVRSATFKSLGSYIATFVQPPSPNLTFSG